MDATIRQVFPEVANLTVDEWASAHADLTWANVMGPQFCIIDWEDWGIAPRGLDAATLWGNALAIPALADRVWNERRRDLESRSGQLMALFALRKGTGSRQPTSTWLPGSTGSPRSTRRSPKPDTAGESR
ncbi:hypothetical protein [Streptomyces sp. MBT58]|uniref:hypothetical protein n=1 Tax=Streptomyces sp. MBT58 TaxID=1488389 RepID=UPI001F300391|nr:hypothetical protein [Streptomyces sp. MBT58]